MLRFNAGGLKAPSPFPLTPAQAGVNFFALLAAQLQAAAIDITPSTLDSTVADGDWAGWWADFFAALSGHVSFGFSANGAAIPTSGINALLAAMAAQSGVFSSETIDVSGGTNGAPTPVPEIVVFTMPDVPVPDPSPHAPSVYLDMITDGFAPYILFSSELTLAQSGYNVDTGDGAIELGIADSPTPAQLASKLAEIFNSCPWPNPSLITAVASGNTCTLTDYDLANQQTYSFNDQGTGITVNENSQLGPNADVVTLENAGATVITN